MSRHFILTACFARRTFGPIQQGEILYRKKSEGWLNFNCFCGKVFSHLIKRENWENWQLTNPVNYRSFQVKWDKMKRKIKLNKTISKNEQKRTLICNRILLNDNGENEKNENEEKRKRKNKFFHVLVDIEYVKRDEYRANNTIREVFTIFFSSIQCTEK